MLARAYDELGDDAAAGRARRDAGVLADPRDSRTTILADLVLRLAEPARTVVPCG
jgi:hypothetical protein